MLSFNGNKSLIGCLTLFFFLCIPNNRIRSWSGVLCRLTSIKEHAANMVMMATGKLQRTLHWFYTKNSFMVK